MKPFPLVVLCWHAKGSGEERTTFSDLREVSFVASRQSICPLLSAKGGSGTEIEERANKIRILIILGVTFECECTSKPLAKRDSTVMRI